MKSWYSITAKAGTKSADVSIYDEIGYWGVTAKQFIGDIKALDVDVIRLAINSPGGSVFDAIAMYNALRQHTASVEVTVMGVAASAASLVAMSGDKIVMPENAFMMIHNPLNFAYGNADDLRDMAEILDKIGASLVATFQTQSRRPSRKTITRSIRPASWRRRSSRFPRKPASRLSPVPSSSIHRSSQRPTHRQPSPKPRKSSPFAQQQNCRQWPTA